jgi:hypothetical protein
MRYSSAVLLAGLVLSLSLGSCSSTKKITAPAATTPAAAAAVSETLPPLPPSEIDLPVKMVSRPILRLIDSIVPREFVSEGWPAYLQPGCDFRYRYRFVRSAFDIHLANNRISIQMQGRYQVAGGKCLCAAGKPVSPWISGNCGFDPEPMRRVDLSFSSQVSFLPDYSIRTSSGVGQVVSLDKCSMSVFSVDMTQLIADSIRSSIVTSCKALDAMIAGMNFSKYKQQMTERAGQKTAMGPYGYLSINPTALRVGTLSYTKDTLTISLGISCRPQLNSDSVNPSRVPPLPPLLSGANRSGVLLYLPATYDYAFMNKVINDSVRNRTFEFKGRTFVVKNVEVRGTARHQLDVRIDFEGSHRFSVDLLGTPVLDTAKQTLSIPDITCDLESKELVVKMVRALFKSRIRQSVKGNSYLDLAALLKTNLPMLNMQLNKAILPNLHTTGAIKQLKLIGFLADEKSIQAQLFVQADLEVVASGLR